MSQTAINGPGRIVVGVDGSAGSEHALRWAARQAELTGAALDIIVGLAVPGVLWLGPRRARSGRLCQDRR